MRKIDHEIINNIELYDSSTESIAIIKVGDPAENLAHSFDKIKNIYGFDLLEGSGVYFISMDGDFYIGEAKNLKKRTLEHLKSKKIASITYATSKSKRHELNKDDIKDIEATILSYASDYNFPLTNIKSESTNSLNSSSLLLNEAKSKWVWKGILTLNIGDIIESITNSNMTGDAPDEKAFKITRRPLRGRSSNNIERDMSYDLSDVTKKGNVLNNIPSPDLKIFNHTIRRDDVAKAYRRTDIEIFNGKYAVDVIMDYLYSGLGNKPIDDKYTKGRRNRGWVTAATIAYYKIETNGEAKFTLSHLSETEAREMVQELVNS